MKGTNEKGHKCREQMGSDVRNLFAIVKGPVERITGKEIVEAMQRIKSEKATGRSEVSWR